jgi:hypothetical protein
MDVTLREYLEKIILLEFQSAQRAIEAATKTLDHRLEGMNEFRAQMEKERTQYVRVERFEAFEQRLEGLEKRSANQDGRFWALGIGLTLLMFAVQVWMK